MFTNASQPPRSNRNRAAKLARPVQKLRVTTQTGARQKTRWNLRTFHSIQDQVIIMVPRKRSFRLGFISVEAVRQRLVPRIVDFMVRAWSLLRELAVVALDGIGGIGSAVLRLWGSATRRLNSSLRSHRTWRSSCRHVFSGLNKTMFAPVGPNSHCRGHQGASPAEPGPALEEQPRRL